MSRAKLEKAFERMCEKHGGDYGMVLLFAERGQLPTGKGQRIRVAVEMFSNGSSDATHDLIRAVAEQIAAKKLQ
jgi:hypothetical protein